ncbi:hypothetical protein A2U01_0068651, partial [Trifolium medium]|nr:hypothetical protein [Trifolium medium]
GSAPATCARRGVGCARRNKDADGALAPATCARRRVGCARRSARTCAHFV